MTILALEPVERAIEQKLPPALGKGERSCIAIGVHRQALIVSDDGNARREARRHGLPVSGTIGVLVLNVCQGYLALTEGNAILTKMTAQGYRTPILTLDDLI